MTNTILYWYSIGDGPQWLKQINAHNLLNCIYFIQLKVFLGAPRSYLFVDVILVKSPATKLCNYSFVLVLFFNFPFPWLSEN